MLKPKVKELRAILGTIARVFVGACIAQLAAGGVDVFTLDARGAQTLLSAGIGAAALALFNYVNPKDTRYGLTN